MSERPQTLAAGDGTGAGGDPPRRATRPGILLGILITTILVAPFLIFLSTLDRYPEYYVDEPFFSEPAVRFLGGGEFVYRVSAKAPYSDVVFAAHSPLLPRLQVTMFRLLGVNQFAARVAEYVAGYLAIGVLAAFLLGHGLRGTAVAVAVAWVGDRASQEVMLGRMEGLALLALALGYIELVRVVEVRSAGRAFRCGLGLGTACGFHPICAAFAGMGALILLFSRGADDAPRRLGMPGGAAWRSLAWYAAGGLLPAALVIWLWTPHLREAIAQFRWASQYQLTQHRAGRFLKLIGLLGWSRFYFLGLVGSVVALLVPLAGRVALVGWRPGLVEGARAPWAAAVGFSVAGLFSLLRSMMFPYYLVYFTVWPVIALGLLVDGLAADRRVLRRAAVAVGAVVTLCWAPSLLWNAMRARETMRARGALDQTAFARRLAAVVPAGAPVTGTPELYLIARRTGLDFTPLTWFPEGEPVRPDAWIILSRKDRSAAIRVDPRSLEGRVVVFDGAAFPGVKYLGYPITVFGPQPEPSRRPETRP